MEDKNFIIVKEDGYLAQITIDEVKPTDKVVFEGTKEQCDTIIYTNKKRNIITNN